MKDSLVSCVIPTYKRNDTLERAINSVLNQTYKNLEILIIDDNEPNDEYSQKVQQIIKKINDKRIRYIQQLKHGNGAVARNNGIIEALGKYVAFIDDDDEWLPTKIEKQVKLIETNKNIHGVTCYYELRNEKKVIRKSNQYNTSNFHRKIIDRSVAAITSTLLFNKEKLMNNGLFNENLKRHQDLQLLLDFLENDDMGVVSEYLVYQNLGDGINRPTVSQFVEIKDDFFDQCSNHFSKYTEKEQHRIYSAHYFEIVFVAIKEKKIKIALKYLLKTKLHPIVFMDVYRRYKSRLKE